MISSVDGAVAGASGTSGSINNPADREVFGVMRSLADAIVVGAGTARVEGYRKATRPLVLVSRTGMLPETLRESVPGSVLLATCAASPGIAAARDLLGVDRVLVAGQTQVDLGIVRDLLHARGWASLLCEGGPTLLAGFLAARALDEICVTTGPQIVGGAHPRLTAGVDLDVPVELTALLEEDGTLFARWLIRAAQPDRPRSGRCPTAPAQVPPGPHESR
jgi:riboflavin biosynthesis pyrimidine reductase